MLLRDGFKQFLSPEDFTSISSIIKGLYKKKGSIDNVSIHISDKKGNPIWLHGSINSVTDNLGTIVSVIGIARDITDLKQKELELKKSEERYRLIIENSLDFIYQIDLSGRIIFISDSYEKTFGLEKGTAIGSFAIEFTHPDDHEKISNLIQSTFEQEKPSENFEFRALHPDGNYYWYKTSIAPLYDEDGKLICISGISTNIDALKKLELAYEKASFQAKLGNWEYNLITQEIVWSKKTYQIHEVPFDFNLNLDAILDFYSVDSGKEKLTQAIHIATSTGEFFDLELQMTTPTGKIKWVHTIGQAEFVDGVCHKLFGTLQDISEKKLYDLKLIEASNFNESVLHTIPDLMFILDKAGKFHRWIAGKEEELLMPPELFVDKYVSEVIPSNLQQLIMQSIERTLKSNSIITINYEMAIGLEIRHYEARFNKLPNDHVLVLCRDTTENLKNEKERYLLNNKIQQQNEALQNYAHILSHNLKSLSANITGILYLMKDNNIIDESNEYFGYLNKAALNLNEFTKNISETTSFFTKTDLLIEELSLKDIVSVCLENNYSELKNHTVTIRNFISDNHKITANSIYAENIIYNLITNAIKYRDKERNLMIELNSSIEKNYIHFSIKDNGLGIDLDRYRLRLFGLMKTFHSNPDARGIGLFMVKNQIEIMGGKIEVESKPNVGSTFHVYFPKT